MTDPGRQRLEPGDLEALADPLLLRLLETTVNTDPRIERLLVRARGEILAAREAGALPAAGREAAEAFLAALAQQCFLNEYVLPETAAERDHVDRLAGHVREVVTRQRRLPALELALLAAYRPLRGLSFAPRMFRYFRPTGDDTLFQVLRRHLIEPMQEDLLRAGIPRLTGISDPTSARVRAQYEENPYPRWIHLDLHEPFTVGAYMELLFPGRGLAREAWPEAPSVLVAGCGTGKHPISAALRFADSVVLGIDLSLASLAFGSRMARELGVDNLGFAQADILELGPHLGRFDVIECVGVLHHLADPLAGWRVLRSRLAPGGLMRIGLYRRDARTSVRLARAHARAAGLAPDRDGVRAFRAHVLALPAGHPMKSVMNAPDFYAVSECRDLVFHVCERDFDLDEIGELLRRLELDLVGFELMPAAAAEFDRRHPRPDAIRELDPWQAFERALPRAFGPMYTFWARGT